MSLIIQRGIKKDIYENIKSKYGYMSSFAIWKEQGDTPKSNMGDISFFENPTDDLLNTLNYSFILVGLNISKKIPREFGNFHPDYSSANDYKTRFALKNTIFWGSYMTDIIKDFEQKVAGKMMSYLNKNKSFEKENILKFEEELECLGVDKPIIIAFGNDAYKILNRNLKNKYKIYKVSHYSSRRISHENLRNEILDLEKKITKI